MKNLESYGVQEMSSKDVKRTDGGGPRWSRFLGNLRGYWLSAYAQQEAMGAFKA